MKTSLLQNSAIALTFLLSCAQVEPVYSHECQVTPKEPTLTGTVKWFNSDRGFGFIQLEDGTDDVFVRRSSIKTKGLNTLEEGQHVRFAFKTNPKGREALNVMVVSDNELHALTPSTPAETTSDEKTQDSSPSAPPFMQIQIGDCESLAPRITKVITEQFGIKENSILSSTRFVEDIGADSLNMIEFVMAFEEEFEIEIPDEDVEKLKTVQQAANYMALKIKCKKSA